MTELPPYDHEPVTAYDGTPVIGWSPSPRCLCSHALSIHYVDRRGRNVCASAACGCAIYRPKETAK